MEHRKIYFSPVGCPKANVDLEKLAWILTDQGFEIVQEVSDASVAVVLGCAFIDDAKRETIGTVLDLVEMKQRGDLERIVLAGCLPEKYGDETGKELPEIDALVGNSCLGLLPEIIREVYAGRLAKRIRTDGTFAEWAGTCDRWKPAATPWTRTLLISDGCDNACTYCAIPHMRGPLRSRPALEVIDEARVLAGQGAREIILAGQDIASYGRDRGKRELAALVGRLADELPSSWLRLSYANPDNLEPEIARAMRGHPNVCRYVDMPIQHASPEILRRMGRCHDIDRVRELVTHLRDTAPDISLRTSVIVGFPGEMESDFGHLLDFLEEIRFDLAGVFTFSPQPGTPAAALDRQVPDDVKEARLVEVVSLQEMITRDKMQGLVGKTLQVLVEDNAITHCDQGRSCGVMSTESRTATGRTQYDMPEIDRVVHLRDCRARPGQLVTARIDGVTETSDWAGHPTGVDVPR